MKQSVVDAESPSKSSISLVHTRVVKNTYLLYKQDMNKFEFKNLVKDLKAVSYTHLTLPTNREV